MNTSQTWRPSGIAFKPFARTSVVRHVFQKSINQEIVRNTIQQPSLQKERGLEGLLFFGGAIVSARLQVSELGCTLS